MNRLITGATLATAILVLAMTVHLNAQLARVNAQLNLLANQVQANTKAIDSLKQRTSALEAVQ